MNKCNFFKKLFLIICSLIFTLTFIEVSLRLASYFYPKSRALKYSKDGAYAILCIGDSYTMGFGAPRGKDYPSQLEEILNSKSKNLNFRVINGVIGGGTTSTAVNLLNEFIIKYKPDMLVVILGCNDNWNYTDLNLSCIQNDYVPYIIKLDSAFSRLKTFKLMKIIFINLRNKIKILHRRFNSKEYKDLTKNPIKFRSEREKYYIESARKYYHDQHNLDAAIDCYYKALEINPENAEAYCSLAHIYQEQGKFKEAIDYSKKILNMDSADSAAKHSALLQLMCLSRPDQDKYYDEEVDRILKENESFARFEGMVEEIHQRESHLKDNSDLSIRARLINKIVLCNFEKIAMIAKDNDIRLIFCSYPEFTIPHIDRLCKEFNITFINFQPIFKEILKTENREGYFVPDGHCNANGYRVMADAIADRILDE